MNIYIYQMIVKMNNLRYRLKFLKLITKNYLYKNKIKLIYINSLL